MKYKQPASNKGLSDPKRVKCLPLRSCRWAVERCRQTLSCPWASCKVKQPPRVPRGHVPPNHKFSSHQLTHKPFFPSPTLPPKGQSGDGPFHRWKKKRKVETWMIHGRYRRKNIRALLDGQKQHILPMVALRPGFAKGLAPGLLIGESPGYVHRLGTPPHARTSRQNPAPRACHSKLKPKHYRCKNGLVSW